MKTILLIITFLVNLTSFAQIQDSTDLMFIEPEIKIGSFTLLPIVYSGGCLCRPDYRSRYILDSTASFLKKHDKIKVQIEVYTDSRGVEEMNLKHSDLTARNVASTLTERGINEDRIIPTPKGESQPWIVTKEDFKKYPFLQMGKLLTDDYISELPEDQRNICHSLNSRTVLRIIEIEY